MLCGAGAGLSPRGRGNHLPNGIDRRENRTIPAWAGEPISVALCQIVPKDYPRVGGGTYAADSFDSVPLGLSPRGRGNPQRKLPPRPSGGTIPAWAGEPQHPRPPKPPDRDYPRVGGGTQRVRTCSILPPGLSPRGRGNLLPGGFNPKGMRTIPAWAGEPVEDRPAYSATRDYPRVGGGTPPPRPPFWQNIGLSPRGRGNPNNPE